jgi:bacterioferritin-associated ferredoxin
MWVCLCNPFNDKALNDYLNDKKDQKVKIADAYKHLSGGAKPQCGQCTRSLKSTITSHNNNIKIQ